MISPINMERRRNRLALALVAVLLSIPAGYGIGQEFDDEGAEPSSAERVDMASCDAEIRSIFNRAGVEVDGFLPGCPGEEEAREHADAILQARQEYDEGQARIAALRESGRLQEVDEPTAGFED